MYGKHEERPNVHAGKDLMSTTDVDAKPRDCSKIKDTHPAE